jgi:hypothetical protein
VSSLHGWNLPSSKAHSLDQRVHHWNTRFKRKGRFLVGSFGNPAGEQEKEIEKWLTKEDKRPVNQTELGNSSCIARSSGVTPGRETNLSGVG